MSALPIILIAEDNPADRALTAAAFDDSPVRSPIRDVRDGEELMDYLLRQGRYAGTEPPRPALILLDINMPRKNGLEALGEIKAHPGLRRIPVVMLTTSQAEVDVQRSYDLGANSFITKPIDFDEFRTLARRLAAYWLEAVTLPREPV